MASIDSVHTSEIGAATARDTEILDIARSEGRTVVTLDADFHALLALSGMAKPSVIRIRMEGLRAEQLSILLQAVIGRCQDDLDNGAAVTVQERRLKIRRLPILK